MGRQLDDNGRRMARSEVGGGLTMNPRRMEKRGASRGKLFLRVARTVAKIANLVVRGFHRRELARDQVPGDRIVDLLARVAICSDGGIFPAFGFFENRVRFI